MEVSATAGPFSLGQLPPWLIRQIYKFTRQMAGWLYHHMEPLPAIHLFESAGSLIFFCVDYTFMTQFSAITGLVFLYQAFYHEKRGPFLLSFRWCSTHWPNSMGDPGVLSNFLNWLVWCCFQCLKVEGSYIWKVPTFSNSFVLSEGNKEHIKRPWRNPFRIYINCISLVSKFVFVLLAAQLGWV